MSTIDLAPVRDRSAWRGGDVAVERDWELHLDDAGRAELVAALQGIEARGLTVADLTPAAVPLTGSTGLLTRIADEVRDGRGFALLRGFPVEGHTLDQIEKMYAALCCHLGTLITQNSDATLIHYVTAGRLRPNQGTRGVGVPTETPLHVDLTDAVSLLCVRQAEDDPPSWLASSTNVFNEILHQRPDLLGVLLDGFEWDRLDEHAGDETPASGYHVPVFSVAVAKVSCRYNRYWMAAADRRADRRNTPEQREALDLFDRIAAEHRLEFTFEPGDVQFANNYTVLHGRAAHATETEEDRMRLLLRIWVDFPEARPTVDDAIVRYGVVRHGNLGWTAEELRSGHVGSPRPRRADGAVALV